jgi:phenylacetate-coenzyme A ligase PaaK-like adenylate-forming protein
MRAAWGVEPFDCLGLTEVGIAAVDCAMHAGLHLFEDSCLFEVVDEDGRPVPPGRPGHKVLVTNLDNRVQPFSRFEVTDLVTVSDEPCACGRTFRRITAIEGRSDDVLEMPGRDGRTIAVHPIHLRSPLAAMPAVAQYQIVHEPGRLDVTVALLAGASGASVARDIEQLLARKLDELGVVPVTIAVRMVPRIAREEGAGKFKLVKACGRPVVPATPAVYRTGSDATP